MNGYKETNSLLKEIRGQGQGDFDLDTLTSPESKAGFGTPFHYSSPLVAAGGKIIHRSSIGPSGEISSRQSHSFSFSHVDNFGDMPSSCIGSPLLSSSCIELNLDTMDESELRSTLEEVIMENSLLKSEIEEKNRQISKAKSQVKALLNLETSVSQSSCNKEVRATQGPFPSFCEMMTASMNEDNNLELPETMVESTRSRLEELEEGIRILPENTFVFIREITSRIEVNQDAIRERMLEGLHVSNQILLGGGTGWVAAYLLKNFGKTAFTALGGGAFILGFANWKGYVDINWSEIYEELQRQSEQRQKTVSEENGTTEEDIDWTTEKIRNIKEWINNHSITVGGFACGFLYNIF